MPRPVVEKKYRDALLASLSYSYAPYSSRLADCFIVDLLPRPLRLPPACPHSIYATPVLKKEKEAKEKGMRAGASRGAQGPAPSRDCTMAIIRL